MSLHYNVIILVSLVIWCILQLQLSCVMFSQASKCRDGEKEI